MTSRKFLGISAFASLSFGLMGGCSDSSVDANTAEVLGQGGIEAGTQNLCGDLISLFDETSNTTYCFDANNQLQYFVDAAGNTTNATIGDATQTTPSGDPSIENPSPDIPATNVCVDPVDGTVAINTVISSADGSTYMYDANCNKIILTQPTAGTPSTDTNPIEGTDTPASSTSVAENPVGAASSSSTGIAVSSGSYESASNGNSPTITYATSGATLTNDNGCVTVNGGEVEITCAGEYEFSGSYKGADAQIRVNSPKADSGVYLNLRGLTLENTADAPIYVQQASKTFVVAKSETVNTLSDGSTRTKAHTYVNNSGVTKTDTTNAAIYSKDDMTFKGTGTLNVTGNYNNGIQSSNDLRFRGETIINVTAKNNGIKGKGLVDVEKGNITITATSGDGIKSDECTVNGSDTTITEGKGIVSIKGGSINIIKAGDDGIQAFNYVMISDSVSVPSIKINSTGKGIVSENRVYINGGENTITSGDDGVHSNLNIDFNGGFTTITAKGNDGVHADSTLRITNGTVYVKDSYEGLEAWYITISGGVTDVYGSDDGWNAAGGNDGSGNSTQTGGNNWGNRPGGFGGGMGGMGSSSGHLTVTGGVHYVKTGSGDTDGIDSNGELTISGGVVVVECQISGGMGGSFDSDGTATLTTKTLLGFSKSKSEAGTSYNVSFNTNGYYGNSSIAFKPTTSGSYIQGTSQVSTVSNVNSYSKNVTFPNGSTVYYN